MEGALIVYKGVILTGSVTLGVSAQSAGVDTIPVSV